MQSFLITLSSAAAFSSPVISKCAIVFSAFNSMGAPFGDFGRVRPPLSAVWGARPFATTHQSSRARLGGSVLPLANDVRPATYSGLPGCGVGGAFYRHGRSVQVACLSINHNVTGAVP